MKAIKIRDLFKNPPSRGDAEFYPAADVEALVADVRDSHTIILGILRGENDMSRIQEVERKLKAALAAFE